MKTNVESAAASIAHTPAEGGSGRLAAGEATVDAASLFREHARWVASFVLKLGVPRDAIDDLVQETFLVAHRRGGYRAGAAKPTTWLAEIAVRVVSTHRRGERRRRLVPDESVLAGAVASDPTPDRHAEGRATLALAQRALEELDLGKRAVFVLFELMDESCDEIARGLDIPVGTVHSRLFAARREFQAAFARLDPGDSAPDRPPTAEGRGRP